MGIRQERIRGDEKEKDFVFVVKEWRSDIFYAIVDTCHRIGDAY